MDDLGSAENDDSLNHVFQFPDVSRPIVLGQDLQGLCAQGDGRFARGVLAKEVLDQEGDVFFALPQRR